MRAVVAAVTVASLLLTGRAMHLSFADGERYQAFAAEQDAQQRQVSPQGRGSIVSADGRKLAVSLEASTIVATPYQIEAPKNAAGDLAQILKSETGQDEREIESKLTQKDSRGHLSGYSVLGTVGPEAAEKVRNLGIEGITLVPGSDRVYPDGELAGQLTGYLSDHGKAFGGVEARYDKRLKSGQDVRVTIDTAVQEELQTALVSAVKEYHAKSALGVVMRVDDGAVVAVANEPGYDNNLYTEASADVQRDRVLTDPYEPGSTFKPFTIASALEEGTLTPDDTFTVADQIQVADRVVHDSEPHPTEVMYPENILQRSSNVGTIQIAEGLGGQLLYQYIRRFGFGDRTGVDLWGEDPGSVPAYEDWSGSSIGNIPMGQGLTVTPLQLAAGYAALANGGLKVTPYVAQDAAPKGPGPRVISAKTSDIVRGMLQSVVDSGTGRFAQIPGYTVAGKTGTSQKVDPVTGTYGEEYVSSFVGFAPASRPEYVTLIAVDEPQGLIWGERVAAPAFEKVMSFTLGYFNVVPDAPEESGSE
ncbi:MAG TPA: penicillin-binding protein 2 [Rubrobacteraceae bacterium]|nr:penicillin-binding protein 2 [Rubrobacteraceae bacterium]